MTNYISAYTGAQIDAAIANVSTKMDSNKIRYAVATGEVITSTSLVDIAGLTIPLTAGTYLFEASVHGASSATGGYRLGVQYSGTATSIEANHSGQTTTTAWGATARITALNTASTTLGTTNNAETQARITGIIVVSNSGNLTIQGLKVTSGNYTVRASSWLKVVQIA
jgi:hypothetical protein